jgi:hypothetical protein
MLSRLQAIASYVSSFSFIFYPGNGVSISALQIRGTTDHECAVKKHNPPPSGLLSLPAETLASIMEYLDWNDVLSLRQVRPFCPPELKWS